MMLGSMYRWYGVKDRFSIVIRPICPARRPVLDVSIFSGDEKSIKVLEGSLICCWSAIQRRRSRTRPSDCASM